MARSFPLNVQGILESAMQKGGITFILTISDFCLQNYQLPHNYFVLKMTARKPGLLTIICKLMLHIQMYRKKVQGPVSSSQFSCNYTFCLFHFL